jgi:hypothetical protein
MEDGFLIAECRDKMSRDEQERRANIMTQTTKTKAETILSYYCVKIAPDANPTMDAPLLQTIDGLSRSHHCYSSVLPSPLEPETLNFFLYLFESKQDQLAFVKDAVEEGRKRGKTVTMEPTSEAVPMGHVEAGDPPKMILDCRYYKAEQKPSDLPKATTMPEDADQVFMIRIPFKQPWTLPDEEDHKVLDLIVTFAQLSGTCWIGADDDYEYYAFRSENQQRYFGGLLCRFPSFYHLKLDFQGTDGTLSLSEIRSRCPVDKGILDDPSMN